MMPQLVKFCNTSATRSKPEKTSVYLMDKPGAQQSMIYAVQLAPPRNAPEAVQLGVVNNLFGGNFGSRINMNLREDKHWSYGVRSSVLAEGAPGTAVGGVFETTGEGTCEGSAAAVVGLAGACPAGAAGPRSTLGEADDAAPMTGEWS